MSEELKNCPFCGGRNARVTYLNELYSPRKIYCPDCKMEFGCFGSNETCLKYWNTRPEEDRLKAENERLKSVIAEIAAILATGAEFPEDDVFSLCKNTIGEKLILARYNEKLRERVSKYPPDMDDGGITEINGENVK